MTGLTTSEVEERRARGEGETGARSVTKSTGAILHENICTLFNALNFAIAILLFAVGAYSNMLFIAIIILNIVIGIVQEFKAKKLVDELTILNQPHAVVLRDGKETTIEAGDIVKDDVMVLDSGKQICNDAVVIDGRLEVNESLLTGESDSIDKTAGSELYSGSSVISGRAYARVTHVGDENYTNSLINEVRQEKRVHSELLDSMRKVTRFTSFLIIPLGVLLFVEAMFLRHSGTYDAVVSSAAALLGMLPKGLVLLISVSLATGVIRLAKAKILVQNIYSLETLAHVDVLCLDKTGTLTKGEPAVAGVKYLATFDERLTGAMAASLAAMNKHPLSQAIARWAHERHLPVYQVEGFTAIPGAGVEGRIERGMVRLVNLRWLEEQGLADEEVRRTFAHYTNEGMSAVAVADAFGVQAVFGLADVVKEDTVEGLRQLASVGIRPWLLTGDNEAAARALAEKVGLKDVRADLLPEDKLKAIEELQKSGLTAMAGDGINDAPALARADIGIAMGVRGTDSAIEAAHIAVMDDRISSIATLVRLSRITHGLLVENIAFAIGVKIIFALLALTGNATMWMAVFADTGTCLIVVANAMRMLRMKPRLDRMAEEARRAA